MHAWPGNDTPNNTLPKDICNSIKIMQTIKKANSHLENNYEEICLEVIDDLLPFSASSNSNEDGISTLLKDR
jgi:hypothetical protein